MPVYKSKLLNIIPNSRFVVALKPYFLSLNILLLFIYCISISKAYSQEYENDGESLQKRAVKVFLDVSRHYQEYIKIEIPFVNYVRDRKQAQVHIMMTTQETGSGGREYTVTFTGQQDFTAVNDTLLYVSQQMDTEEIVRRGIVRILKIGLIRYVGRTPLADYLSITYRKKTDPAEVVDKWDYWVFNINTNSRLEGEESKKRMSLRGSVSADRVTPDWKTSFYFGADYDKRDYDTDDGRISSYTRSQDFQSLIVKSISKHWSAGAYVSAQSSSFRNIDFSYNIAPAIEFNVFPYSESTYREFRILYKADYTDVRYVEETIFEEIQEYLFDENLTATYEIKEKWGSVQTTLEGSHYFHDISKNQLELRCNLDIRIFEGLSLDLFGSVSRIHDQLSLPKEDATEEEILLNRRQLATQYDYFTSIGLRYTFGSIYSNVVNPRFGTGRRRRGYRY